jgi:hypothetical protein
VEHVVKDELNDILERVAERVEELRDGKEGEKDTLNDDTGRLKSPDTRTYIVTKRFAGSKRRFMST